MLFISDTDEIAMKAESTKKHRCLTLNNIFRHMMEKGYNPTYEQTHIQFGIGDDTAVLEYNGNILTVRLFFMIDEDEYDMFLEASNMAMLKTYAVKAAVLDDMSDLMFSCEFMCENIRDFERFLPCAISLLKEALRAHKDEMRRLILASGVASATIPATEGSMAGIGKRKIIS